MPIYISLLRGINVGGHKKIKMEALRALYDSLGLTGSRSHLQSGNVVFASDLTDGAALARRIEGGIEGHFGFHSDIILRTVDEFRAVIERHRFTASQLAEPSRSLVMFLSSAPDADAIDALMGAHTGPEDIHFSGQEIYLYYPNGSGRSKLTNAFIEKKLQRTGTARNWNTVTRLLALADEFDDPTA